MDNEIVKNIQVTTFGNSDLIESAYKEECDIIEKELKRLEQIENLRTTPNALETCLANYMNKCIDLEKENNNLKKALDKACEMLEWGCPVEQDLIDYLDCENCKNTEKECWKKYFLKEVFCND